MSSPKIKKRNSILKKRQSSCESPELTAKIPKRGILFSEKNTIKEFMQCEDKGGTIWGNTYEESVTKSSNEVSAVGTQKLGFDFSSSMLLQASSSSTTSMISEAEKENIHITKTEVSAERQESATNLSIISSSSASSSIANITVPVYSAEKKRMKYDIDNLNITNMESDIKLMGKNPVRQTAEEEKLVSSPRKTIYYHDKPNMSICVVEKVFVKPSEIPKQNLLIHCSDASLSMIEDEHQLRKTTLTKPSDKQSKKPKIQQPKIPKVFKMSIPSSLEDSNMNLDSPVLKPPQIMNQKLAVEDFVDFMITETPTKNLCRQMCATKKHDTPSSRTKKVIFSSTRFDGKLNMDKTQVTTTSSRPLRKTMDIFDELGLNLDKPGTAAQKKTESISMDITEAKENIEPSRKTIHQTDSIESSILAPEDITSNTDGQNRQTIFQKDISFEVPSNPACNNADKQSANTQHTFFDLDIDETVAVTKSMTLMRLKDIPVAPLAGKKTESRETIFSNDISYTCHIGEQPSSQKSSRQTTFECSNIDQTAVLGTTAELALEADDLLRNPLVTASNSNLFSQSFHPDESLLESFREMSTVENSLYVERDHHQQSLQMEAVVDTSGRMNLTDLVAEQPSSKTVQSRGTIYCDNDTMNITSANRIQDYASVQPNMSASKIRESPEQHVYVQKTSVADSNFPSHARATIYNDNNSMDITKTSPMKEQSRSSASKSSNTYMNRLNIYTDDTNISGVEPTVNISFDCQKQNRSNSELPAMRPQHEFKKPIRATIFESEAMNETLIREIQTMKETTSVARSKAAPKISIYQDESIKEEVRNSLTNQDHKIVDMIDDDDDDVIVKARRATLTTRVSIFEDTPIDVYEKTISVQPSGLTSPIPEPKRLSVYGQHEMDIESTVTFQRKSVIVCHSTIEPPSMDISNCGNFAENVRKTIADIDTTDTLPAMCTTRDFQLAECFQKSKVVDNIERRKTYTIRQCDDSKHNITDSEMLLYDESEITLEPCLDTSDTPTNDQSPMCYGLDRSDAFKDLINITIKNLSFASPSSYNESANASWRESPSKSIDERFDELLESIECKSEPPIKLELDAYLEKLNIQIPKIQYRPELDPENYRQWKQEVNDRLECEIAEEKEREAAQFPQIPSFSFLLNNWLECDLERIKKENAEARSCVTPIFPESRDFEFLLKNKFETDSHLKEFWVLDTMFSFWGHYKLTHKAMNSFKINFTIHKDMQRSLEDSTIPIVFEKVTLYVNPWYRGKVGSTTRLIRKHFERLIGTDDLTAMCHSMKQFFEFVSNYHEQVKKSAKLVMSFLNMLDNYDAVLWSDDAFNPIIMKRVWLQNQRDMVDIRIHLYGHIDDVCYSNISVKGLSKYSYQLNPKQQVVNLKGMFLIETILFDVERMLNDATRAEIV